eukprot:CAMPEP_0172416128 /NCGR_PEP_ID=MMETSP1064-20121228/2561_1 /TAXON_ID=202472 /ORGANISM="Aulacoseira subarctica , Strain CCAP 1002/5" /LENGTH=341 /DNA_ID=CAMNT_0013153537 /DNA_START=217 /DNA_END=1242 /DNA_ORIENTATION=-
MGGVTFRAATQSSSSSSSSTALNAIGVLAKKAKEMELRKYVETGVPASVMEKFHQMKTASGGSSTVLPAGTTGPVQKVLTKRRGTIAVIAEYKRKLTDEGKSGFIADEVLEPKIMSKTFREFGATAVAAMADVAGGTYEDLASIDKEQATSKGDMPGPICVVSSDLIVDELQLAMAAVAGAQAVVLTYGVVGHDKCRDWIPMAHSIGLESIVSVATKEEAQGAIDAGGRIILANAFAAPDKVDMVADLNVPEGETICKIASIIARDNKQLEEIEEAWFLRDAGFQAVWAGDCLYKAGNDPSEHAGAIIRSMIAKSSVKWASAKAKGGKGEGAREYLGDLLM